MCVHTTELTKKRNAVVCLRQGLLKSGILRGPFSPLSEELSRHENYYDWLLDQWQEDCPVCLDIAYSREQYPAALRKIEKEWEDRVCEDLDIWGKKATRKVIVPIIK
jgi:hypothetical protein